MTNPNRVLITLSIVLISAAACKSKRELPEGLKKVELNSLPSEVRFNPVGNIGEAYQLTSAQKGELSFPVNSSGVEDLIPGTVRLYLFSAEEQKWREMPDSKYLAEKKEIIGSNLQPGYYTAFGWSSNPMLNSMQRLWYDHANNFGSNPTPHPGPAGIMPIPGLNPGPGIGIEPLNFGFRSIIPSFKLIHQASITICNTNSSCPTDPYPLCKVPGNIVGSTCSPPCTSNSCCNCTTKEYYRVVIPPVSVSPDMPICQGTPLCPICPNGLSCPGAPFAPAIINPDSMREPNFNFLVNIGLEELRNNQESLRGLARLSAQIQSK